MLPTVLCGIQAMDVEQLNKDILSVLSADDSVKSYKADSDNPKYSSWTTDNKGYVRIDQRIYVPDSGDLWLNTNLKRTIRTDSNYEAFGFSLCAVPTHNAQCLNLENCGLSPGCTQE